MPNTRVIVTRYGGPEVLAVVEQPLRSPRPGEVRVRVASAGVALADVMRREGVYPGSPPPPFTPGYDVVGVVDEIGVGVDGFSRGDHVAAFFSGTGGYASHVWATVDDLYPVPVQLDPVLAVASILNYVTAYQMLHRIAHVAAGESILVHGASGGVGTALLDLGNLAQLRMFGTASAAKHSSVSHFGAVPIDYRSQDFVDVLRRELPGGIDAVFDPIGGRNWQRSLETLSGIGRFVGYGYTTVLESGDPSDWPRDWAAFAQRGTTEEGNPVRMYSVTSLRKERPDWFREDLQQLFALLREGRIHPLVSHRIPLRDAAYAHEVLNDPGHVGKIVLTVG